MKNLDIFDAQFLEVTEVSGSVKLSPVVSSVSNRVLLARQLLHRRYHSRVCRVEEEWDGKPLPFGVHHHSMLDAFILIVAPYLYDRNLKLPQIRYLVLDNSFR